jgi:hypothetical protein
MKTARTLSALCLSLLSMQLWAQAPANDATTVRAVSLDALKQLRDRIAAQEKEIANLQQSLAEQRGMLDRALKQTAPQAVSASAGGGSNQVLPVVNVARPHAFLQKAETESPSPLAVKIGNAAFAPLGFVDATFYGRSSNVGSGIGTNFGGIPYNNSASEHLSEANFSTQNSRLGFRVDSSVLGSKVLGYFEADFLGNQPANVFVTSNSDTFRMRNVFVDVRKNGFEVLAGQDWSLATPNRKGLSPLPSDIFYTQNMDTNYQAGLVWARQTQFRFVAHPSANLALGVSLENPQQYLEGSGGVNASAVTLPSAYSSVAGSQANNGSNSFSAANLHPDVIFKAAYDGHAGEKIMHVEAGGMVRSFKIAAPATPFTTHTATAGAGEINANLELVKGFHLVANTFFGSGNGRYVFGLAPDFIVRADGSLSPIHTYSTVDGFEWTVHKNTLLYGYYGAVYIKRNVGIDTTGKTPALIGYGFTNSGINDNRAIQEGTFGVVQTFWKSPGYGALSLITQYSYLSRNPWSIATGVPKDTHTNMYWVDLRYTLP